MKKLIIQLLCAEILRLRVENENLKTSPIEKVLNTVFDISTDSVVDFNPEYTSPTNRYTLVSDEKFAEINAQISTNRRNTPQWKSSEKDGLPVLQTGDIIIYKESLSEVNYKMMDCPTKNDLDVANEYLSDYPAVDYIIIKIPCN